MGPGLRGAGNEKGNRPFRRSPDPLSCADFYSAASATGATETKVRPFSPLRKVT